MPGPITQAEFLALWRSVTDPAYSDPFVRQGEGKGLEAHTQAFEQAARVSQGIDVTTQAMYLLPFSGQTSQPSRFGQPATVTLELRRSENFDVGIVLERGTLVEEIATDAGDLGPIQVATGRRYFLAHRIAFSPGDAGPLLVEALSERQGFGYNNPLPGTITRLVQPGAGLTNDGASLVPGDSVHELVLKAEPDVIAPQQVGQYVEMISGSNAGQVRLIVDYGAPLVDPMPTGGSAFLSAMGVYRLLTSTGTLVQGEEITQPATTATGTVIAQTATHVFIQRTGTLAFTPGPVAIGTQSSVMIVIDIEEVSPTMSAESGTAAWRVLYWSTDLGISVTNPASPTGGIAPMLEELASERSVFPFSGESEAAFRKRATEAADVVSPNALARTANRTLAKYGEEVCFREVGYPKFRGLFFDGDPTSTDPAIAFAFDLDFAVRPEDSWKVLLDYVEFRAFFVMGVPALSLGEFGAAFDAGSSNAFDSSPYLTFFDGFPMTAAGIYSRIWQDLYRARAGGVGFDLYVESSGCV